jgi:hypothetical protein
MSAFGGQSGVFRMTLPKKYETKILYQNQPLELAGAAVQMAPCSTLFSLPTGNFTGNFAKPRLRQRQRLQIIALSQGFRREFPTQQNRELFGGTGSLGAGTGNFEIIAGLDFGHKGPPRHVRFTPESGHVQCN